MSITENCNVLHKEQYFQDFVCTGDTIERERDGFTVTARIEFDPDSKIDDDDCHNTDQSVTGCNEEQFARLLEARTAWFKDEWAYCGIVLSVSRAGVVLDDHAASLWAIEMNYPGSNNYYLTECVDDMLDEALITAKRVLEKLVDDLPVTVL